MLKKFLLFIIIVSLALFLWYFFRQQVSIEIETKPVERSVERSAPVVKEPPALAQLLGNSLTSDLSPIETPAEIKAVYVTASTALSPGPMSNIVNLVENTELNSVVINIKDGSQLFLNKAMADLVKRLREKGIYPIARVVIFQDNFLAEQRPDLALKNPDGSYWGKANYRWVDPASQEARDYNAEISIRALDMGFKEINFDYIRFPDGNVDDIVYPFYEYSRWKKDVINEAAEYIVGKIKTAHPEAVVSLDIFAHAFLRPHDIGIGQKLTELIDYFDVIAPMIYPSHYNAGNFGFENPANEPYQVVLQTLQSGLRQLEAAGKTAVIRPWIQDFNMGAVYDREKIQVQIQAIKDALGDNYTGFMSWNPNNIYNLEKYEKAPPRLGEAGPPEISGTEEGHSP